MATQTYSPNYGLPNNYQNKSDSLDTPLLAADLNKIANIAEAQWPVALLARGYGVIRDNGGELLVSTGSGLSVNVASGLAIVGASGFALGAENSSTYNVAGLPANRGAGNEIYLFVKAGDGTSGSPLTVQNRQAVFKYGSSSTMTGAVLLATITTGPSSVLTCVPNPDRFIASGDMRKAVYDTDNDGVVDNAELVGGYTPAQLRDRSTHTGTQTASTISDIQETIEDRVGALVQDSSTIDATYNDAGGIESLAVIPAGIRLDQLAAPTASVSLNSQKITNLAAPTSANDAARKTDVDTATSGVAPRFVTQTAHGFTNADLFKGIKPTGNNTYAAAGLVEGEFGPVGVITNVVDANHFYFQPLGPIVTPGPTLTAGLEYYVQGGSISSVKPTTVGKQYTPYLRAINTTEGVFLANKVETVPEPVVETLGTKLRRLARQAQNLNPYLRPYMKAVPAWQPSTAYVLGDMVANGGNVYIQLSASGTSGTSIFTARTDRFSTSDGGALWFYYGPNEVARDPSQTVLTWTASTAYTLGTLVRNSNKIYACVTAGTSAGSGGPTGTANSNTDNTVIWTYLGVDRDNPACNDFPTYTSSLSAPAGLSNVYNPQTTMGLAATKLRGCYAGPNFGGNWVRTYVFTPTSGATALSQFGTVEFFTDAPKFYIWQTNGASRMLVFIDGIRYNLAPTNANTGGNTYHVFDFGTGGRKNRRIRIETFLFNLGQIGVDANSQVWAPDDVDKVTAVCISDSIWQGSASYGPYVPGNSVSQRLSHELGWSDVWSYTQGSTGYVNRGTGMGVTTDKYDYRIAEGLTRNPDIWVFMGSTNDMAENASTITAAALATFQAIRTGGSTAPIVVFGVWPVDDSAQSTGHKVADAETALQAAVTAFADSKTWFIPLRNVTVPWLTGTWNNTNNTNSTNSGVYQGGDNIHPLDSGTAYLARRIAVAIREQVLPNIK